MLALFGNNVRAQVIVFTVKSITKGDGDEFKVTGDLTIKGLTHQVVLNYEHNGSATDHMGNTKVGGTLTGTIDRSTWGLEFKTPIPGGDKILSDKIKLEVDGELVQVPDEAQVAAGATA